MASLEISDGATRKPFRATGLLNKSQLKLASYIQQNKNVTLQGTKRFLDKSGEYYLKNIQLQNRQKDPHPSKVMSLNNPQNLENVLSRDFNRIKRKASKIVTLLPENALTPIPKKDIKDGGLANKKDNKDLNDAQRTAVFIRRMEYATTMRRKMDKDKNLKDQAKKIALIQEWWKTMFKIIKLQKNIRGFLFRKKLMNNLEHQEKLLQFITEFDNIHNYHLYKQFMDNLKKKRDYENSKLMEKCEDFNEKLDNLEKLHNYKNFKNCFKKWKEDTQRQKKEDLDNLARKLNDIWKKKEEEDKKDALDKIKQKADDEEKKLNDKIKDFKENSAKKKFMKDLIKAHRLNKMLNDIKNKLDNKNKKNAFDKLKYFHDITKGADKLKKLMDDKKKKDAWNDMKTMDFVQKLDDLINNHNDKVYDEAKKDLFDKLKDLSNKKLMRDKLRKWKAFNDDMRNRNKIINKLKRYKLNELKKKEQEEKNKLAISSGVNDFELISDKKNDGKFHKRDSQIFISPQNDINFMKEPANQFVLSRPGQSFSFIPPELIKFEQKDPALNCKKMDRNIIPIQLNEIDSFLNNKKNNEKSYKMRNTLDTIKKVDNRNNLKEYLDRWRNAAQKLKQDSLNDLANKLNDILTRAKKASNQHIEKDIMDKLRKKNDIANAANNLEKLLNKKLKQKALNALKKNAGMSEGFRILDKLAKNHGKKDFFDELQKRANISKASDKLKKLINDKLKKDAFDRLKLNNNIKKACDKLDKIIKDKNDKNKKDTFDDLKTMDFVDILKKFKKKHNDKDKDEKARKFMNNLEKIKKDGELDDKKKYFKRWLDKCKNREIFDKLKAYQKEQNKNKMPYKSKRISRRRSPKKFRSKNKNKINKNKKLLKDAFDKWRKIASFIPTRNVLDQIKKNKTKMYNLYPKYKKKVLQVLSNIYKTHRNSLLKKYFDKWRKAAKSTDDNNKIFDKNIIKYKKKPKIFEKDETDFLDTNRDMDSFKPKCYIQKHNIYNRRPLCCSPVDNLFNIYSPGRYLDKTNSKRQPKLFDTLDAYTLFKNKNKPYRKKYGHRTLECDPSYDNKDNNNNNYDDDNQRHNYIYPYSGSGDEAKVDDNYANNSGSNRRQNDKEIHPYENDIINIEENYNSNYNEPISDTSSNNESLLNGMILVQNKKITRQPINYTSQSFFIDKNAEDDYRKKNLNPNNKNNINFTNQLPMTMKGDFISLIEQNPKILVQKNPRIQVTNATCDLKQIIDNDNKDELNDEEVNDEIDKLKNSFVIDKSKVLNKVIENCDKDLYSHQKPFYSKKDQWYSVSIPLNDNEAKWEFLNNIKGERDKNNLNKFELIQNEADSNKKEEKPEDKYNTRSFKPTDVGRRSKKNIKDNSYKLQEMNYSKFYRTPARSEKNIFEEEKSSANHSIIRQPRKKRNIKGSPSCSCLSVSDSKDKNKNNKVNNIDRSKGKIQFDPSRKNSADYNDEDDCCNDYDE